MSNKISFGEIEAELNKIWNERQPEGLRNVQIFQFCKTAGGLIERNTFNLKICSDPDCSSCQLWHKMIAEKFSEKL